MFDCPRYTAARAANSRFYVDYKTGRPIKCLYGLGALQRTQELLPFLETTGACFRLDYVQPTFQTGNTSMSARY